MVARSYEVIDIYGPEPSRPLFHPLLTTIWKAWAAKEKTIQIGKNTETQDLTLACSIFEKAFEANERSAGFHIVSGARRVTVAFAVAERGMAFSPIGELFSSIRISIGWLRETRLAREFLSEVSGLTGAWFGWYSPEPSSFLMESRLTATHESLLRRGGEKYETLRQASLPPLKAFSFLDWPDPAIPPRLGWLNFWSSRTAAALGWDAEDDVEPFRGGVEAANDGWILQLTEDALDLRRPDHVAALSAAYARFKDIGTRAE